MFDDLEFVALSGGKIQTHLKQPLIELAQVMFTDHKTPVNELGELRVTVAAGTAKLAQAVLSIGPLRVVWDHKLALKEIRKLALERDSLVVVHDSNMKG